MNKKLNPKRIFYISGIFWEKSGRVNIDTSLRIVIGPISEYFTFDGLLVPQSGVAEQGSMIDRNGSSYIMFLEISENKIVLKKFYENDAINGIHIELTKKMGTWWIGTYKGENVGFGTVNCQIVEISEEFLKAPDLEIQK